MENEQKGGTAKAGDGSDCLKSAVALGFHISHASFSPFKRAVISV